MQLSLSDCELQDLDWLKGLGALKELRLAHNKITVCQHPILCLALKTLTPILPLCRSCIAALENALKYLTIICIFQSKCDVHSNFTFVQVLPDVIRGMQLRILDLGNNDLETLSKIHVCMYTNSF